MKEIVIVPVGMNEEIHCQPEPNCKAMLRNELLGLLSGECWQPIAQSVPNFNYISQNATLFGESEMFSIVQRVNHTTRYIVQTSELRRAQQQTKK